jgi:hypothetical protein
MTYGVPTTNTFVAGAGSAPLAVANVVNDVLAGASLVAKTAVDATRSNPPFALGNFSNPLITAGQDAKIVRGYIRRDPSSTDPTSRYRLNFMFNPGSIQRSYISYLDQGALDPYNTIYQAGNLVAPPGILDFNFELMFDRQIEAGALGNRGCAVDYDYFDRVIRGVEPQAPASTNTIPDNGVLLVNPQTVTVVFSEQLQVQGKVNNAVVSYERFNHRMVPTRMIIGIQMKVTYVGTGLPEGQPFDLHIEQATAEFAATVPYDNTITASITNTVDATAANATGSAFIDALRLDWSGGTSSSTGGVPLQGSDAGAAQPGSAGAPTGNIVDVGGIKVDQSIAANLKSMMEAAAKDNIKLAGGGWRSNAQQIKLRGDHGCRGREMDPNCKCSPPTAVPGKSNHEKGLAIDFSPCGKGSPVFNWLKAHAATYHFYNLPSESWHWSVDGR